VRFVVPYSAIGGSAVALPVQHGQPQVKLPPPLSTEPEKLGDILFDYLPYESPLQNGWELVKENRPGFIPAFSSLTADAPIPVGLSITPTGWYGMDYAIVEARKTRCNHLRFAANFGTDGRIYTLVQMPPSTAGQSPLGRWIQMGVNIIGPPRIDVHFDEGIVRISGKPLGGGWEAFDILLNDKVKDTWGKRGFIYGEHGILSSIRLRGRLSISPIELYRS